MILTGCNERTVSLAYISHGLMDWQWTEPRPLQRSVLHVCNEYKMELIQTKYMVFEIITIISQQDDKLFQFR